MRLFYAGAQLFNMALGMSHMQTLMGLRTRVLEDELTRHLDQVVDDFLRLYAAGKQVEGSVFTLIRAGSDPV